MSPPRTVGLALLVLLGPCLAANAQPADNARLDRYGDPLPAGAIARLGTGRLYQSHNPWVHVEFAPDGKLLATTDYTHRDGIVHLWDVATGKQIREWRVTQPRVPFHVMPLAFSRDGRYLAAGAPDKLVHVWEVATDKEVMSAPIDYLRQAVFAPDGGSLATLTQSGVHVYEFPAGKVRFEHRATAQPVCLAYTGDSKVLVAIGYDEPDPKVFSIQRWDATTGTLQEAGHIASLSNFRARLSPDGQILIVPERRPIGETTPVRMRRWDTQTRKELDPLEGTADYPAQIAFSADGRRLTAMSRQGRLRVWDNQTGKLLHDYDGQLGSVERVALSPDGKIVAATVRSDEAIHLWDVAHGKELHHFGGHRNGPLTVACAADDHFVLTVSRDSSFSQPSSGGKRWSLRRWEVRTGKESTILEQMPKSELTRVALARDGSLAAAAAQMGGRMRIYDTKTGKERSSAQLPTQQITMRSGTKILHQFQSLAASHLVFSRDNKTVAAASQTAIGFWDTTTGKLVQEIALAQGPAQFCLLPDGKSVLVSQWRTGARGPGNPGHVLVHIDVQSGEIIRTFANVNDWGAVAVSDDGRTAAALFRAGLHVWDLASGNELWTGGVGEWSATLAFAPDGRLLATGGRDSVVRLWNVAGGKCVRELAGHDGDVSSLAWSCDGRLLVSASGNVALVWDVRAITGAKGP